MSFWQLVSIFRDDPFSLERLFQTTKWNMYFDWFKNFARHVNQQDRQILDTVLPSELVNEAMQCCCLQFLVRDGFLYRWREKTAVQGVLSATDVYNRYGGAAIEEVLEFGSFGPLNTKEDKSPTRVDA